MTILDSFIAFARALPADRRKAVEDVLAAMMDSYGPGSDFTPEEVAELRRRAAEADPEFSDPQAIARIFGKPFRA